MPENNTTQKSSSIVITLCVLIIVGNVFLILKGLVSYYVLDGSNDARSIGGLIFINSIYLLEFISCFGSIIGAALMLSGKRSGLRIYIISSVLYIIVTSVFAVFCLLIIIGIPLMFLQLIYLIPSIIFLVLMINQQKHLS